jgi:hypothetical protein
MSRLKSTIPVHSSLIGEVKGEALRRSFKFVFSDDILDWQFADSAFGRARRRKHLDTVNAARQVANLLLEGKTVHIKAA